MSIALKKNFRIRAVYIACAAAACIIASIAGGVARWPGNDALSGSAAEAAVHYSPAENLEHIDVALIDQAKARMIWRRMS
jgi:hypothetical protein